MKVLIVIIDNLSNSTEDVLKGVVAITGKMPTRKLDLREKTAVQDFFKRHSDVSGVIHLRLLRQLGKRGKSDCIMKTIVL
jgi:UDP-glucose 4-epimerase